MNKAYNTARPLLMHIDLNSCFATIEQQARPRLRGRPVAVTNRRIANSIVVTASYEAKSLGVKVGMRLDEARYLAPDIIVVETDPPKYRYVYRQLLRIMGSYSPSVEMKSIDEGMINFADAPLATQQRDMHEVGYEIKRRLRAEIGSWMRCNVGIGTNQFLAKTAAGLDKPDGLTLVDATTLRSLYRRLALTDLTGIAKANQKRLQAVGIMTPLEFLDAQAITLEKMVFKSIVGRQWHGRLRGWEVDDKETQLGQIGRQYVLDSQQLSRQQILQRLHHLAESVGSRLRQRQLRARGVYVGASTGRGYWHNCQVLAQSFMSDQAIYGLAKELFRTAPPDIRAIDIHCYKLTEAAAQPSLFHTLCQKMERQAGVVDTLNERYGERTVHAADTLGTDEYVKVKVPFGSTRFLS